MDKSSNPDWKRQLDSYDRGVRRRAARQRERVIMIDAKSVALIRDDMRIPSLDVLNHLMEKNKIGKGERIWNY